MGRPAIAGNRQRRRRRRRSCFSDASTSTSTSASAATRRCRLVPPFLLVLFLLSLSSKSHVLVVRAERRDIKWSNDYDYGPKTVIAGLDHIVLYWNGAQDVRQFSSEDDYNICNFDGSVEVPTEASDKEGYEKMAKLGPFEERRKYYFGCSVRDACFGGGRYGKQKIEIKAAKKTYRIDGQNPCEGVPDEDDEDEDEGMTTVSGESIIIESFAANKARWFKKCKSACNIHDECHGFQFKKGKGRKKKSCPKKTKRCDDGTVVRPDPANNCEFQSCPGSCPLDKRECQDGTTRSRNRDNGCRFDPCPDDEENCSFVCGQDERPCDDGWTNVVRNRCNNCKFDLCPEGSCVVETRKCTDGSKVTRNAEKGCKWDPCPEGTCVVESESCSDGSEAFRNPDLGCEFDPCPESNNSDDSCPKETERCDDGTVVRPDPANNCEFHSCPGSCPLDRRECQDGTTRSRNRDNRCKFDPCPDDEENCSRPVCGMFKRPCDDGWTFVSRNKCNNCKFNLCPEGSRIVDTRLCTDGSNVTRNAEKATGWDPCPEGTCVVESLPCSDGTEVFLNPDLDCEFDPCPEETNGDERAMRLVDNDDNDSDGGMRHRRALLRASSEADANEDDAGDDFDEDEHEDEDEVEDEDDEGRELNVFKDPPECTLLRIIPAVEGGGSGGGKKKRDRDYKCVQVRSRLFGAGSPGPGGYQYDVDAATDTN